MIKTNRRWGGIDRVYEVTAATTIKRGEFVGITSGKLVNCASGTPFGVAMADGTGWDFIPVALNIPWVEWEVDVKTADQATTVVWSGMIVNDKNSVKLKWEADPIFKITEVVNGKYYGYFLAY